MKFEWETSLRDQVHKTQNASTKSLKGVPSEKRDQSSPTWTESGNFDMNAYGKGPMSPVKLTEAQLLAMTQRDEILAMKEAFDTRLKVTDKIGKQSRRRRKKRCVSMIAFSAK